MRTCLPGSPNQAVPAGRCRRGDARRLGGEGRPGRARWRRGPRPGSARQELTLALLLGAAGAAVIFLATRQGWAQVRTTPPKPLPASVVTVTGAAMVPFADALALASLASLAAVLASRRLLRRLTGLLLAVLGAILAASVVSLSQAGAVAAAAANTSPATAGAGSVTQGSASASSADAQCRRRVIPRHVRRSWLAGLRGSRRHHAGCRGCSGVVAGGPHGSYVQPL